MMRNRNNAFTLIELLVVVAIISLLMAILMPALNNARMQARAVACGSNLKQVGMLFQIYFSTNDSLIPPIRDYGPKPTDHTESFGAPAKYWTYFIYPMSSAAQDISWPGWERSSLRGGKPAFRAGVCPEDFTANPDDSNGWSKKWSYGMNGRLGADMNGAHTVIGTSTNPPSGYTSHNAVVRKANEIMTPGSVGLVADMYNRTAASGGNAQAWFYYWDWDPSRFLYPHNNTRNVAYVDGHVEPYRYPMSNSEDNQPGLLFYRDNKKGSAAQIYPN